MAWPGVAVYALEPDGLVTAYAEPDVAPRDVQRVFLRAVLPAGHQRLGWQALHASAAYTPRGVVLFAALSGHGKSTLAYACRQYGLTQWADDSVVLAPTASGAVTIALPFDFSLRPEATRFFHPERGDGVLLLGRIECASPQSAPIAAICLLQQREGDSDTAFARVEPAQAFERLLPHACTFTMSDPDERRRTLEDYLDLSTTVPVWEVRYPRGLERLAGVVEALKRHVETQVSGAS
jgi:hypothetical protein